MPIFEYKCRSCSQQFEALVIPQSGAPACPKCHGKNLEQLISLFAAKSAEKSEANWKAARKKYVRTELREKKVAEREAVQHHLHPD